MHNPLPTPSLAWLPGLYRPLLRRQRQVQAAGSPVSRPGKSCGPAQGDKLTRQQAADGRRQAAGRSDTSTKCTTRT